MFFQRSLRKSRRHSRTQHANRIRRFSAVNYRGPEQLEPRQMLSHSTIEFHPPGLPEGEDHMELPAGLTSIHQTHWLNGMPFELVSAGLPAGVSNQESASMSSSVLHALDSIPQLHSNPSARAKLYLDFDGNFEAQWGGYTNVTTPVYDSDGDPTTFSDAELQSMFVAWSRVAEDYAPFNIDVTLEQPPELAAGVPENMANGVAMRVAIGGDSSWYSGSPGGSGGVAYIGVFTNSIANVVYMFSNNSGDGNYIGDVSSHESGHGFGLYHQSSYDQNGVKTAEYNPGTATWAPIMGGLYTSPNTWHNGPNSNGPTSYQDDMAVLAGSANGFGYRADDHGDTIAAASPLAFDGLAYGGSGIIGTNTDSDAWSFSVSTQDTYRMSVSPAAIGPNLDAILELRDTAGSLIASASPALSQAAELVLPLAPGSYFLMVGKTATYGFLGAYTVNITTPPAGMTVSAAQPLVTREGGPASDFTIVLDTQPTADVVIPVSSSNLAEGVVSSDSLLFTPANWNVPQTVFVTGVDDGLQDDDVNYSIILGTTTSADPEYSGIDPTDLAAINLDNTFAAFVYWADYDSDLIHRSSLVGTNVETLVDLKATFGGAGGDYLPRYLDVDPAGGKMYWTDSAGGVIRRANLNGSGVETVVSGFTGAGLRGIAIDSSAGKMYWADFAAQKIQRANLDGSGVQDLITSSASGVRELKLDIAAGKMYWADLNEHAIRRASLDGSNVETLWLGGVSDRPVGIAVDASAGKVYWSDDADDRIMRANLDGSGVETLIDLSSTDLAALSLAIDARAGKLYFANVGKQDVYRANLDGSGVVPIGVPGISRFQGIAILAPSASVLPRNGLVTSESGSTATFQVALNVPPTADVVIPISSSDTTEGTASPGSLTFTMANWNVPQTVTITGVDDAVYDGNVAYTIITGAATSADAQYNGLDAADVSVTNNDNDPPPTKFYVVNDATANLTYEYSAAGTAIENYGLNSANSAPRGAASTAVGDKVWVVDANRNVYVYNPSGMLLGSWSVSGFNNSAQFEGIAVSGNDVWIVDAKSDKVYRYAGAASRLSGSQNAASSFALNSGNKGPKDIVTDGVHLWVVNDSTADKVFKYTLSGSLVGSWTITAGGGSPTGITIDPANVSDIWIVDSGTDRVYQYNGAATRTSGSQAASLTFALAAGNANPQGIADPPAPSAASTIVNAQPSGCESLLAAAVDQLFAEYQGTWMRKSRIKAWF